MLDELKTKRLEKIFLELKSLDQSIMDDPKSFHFLDSRKSPEGEFILAGNFEGLIHLASTLLGLTQNTFDGKHRHFDEANMLEENAKPFVVSFKTKT